MIGDDVLADSRGALRAGIGIAILVQTGKYRPGDEARLESTTTKEEQEELEGREFAADAFLVCPSIVEAIDFVLDSDI